jgi:hypothetical protein
MGENMAEKLQFKASEVSKFVQTTPHLRYGQEFYHHFKLSEVENPEEKGWCEELFYADDVKAKKMIASRTVWG